LYSLFGNISESILFACASLCAHARDEWSSDGGKNGGKERETVDVLPTIHIEFRKPRAGHFPRERLLPGAASRRSRILFGRVVVADSVFSLSLSLGRSPTPLARWFIRPLDGEDHGQKGYSTKETWRVGKFSRRADQVPAVSNHGRRQANIARTMETLILFNSF